MMAGLGAVAVANRFMSPDRMWFQWVALAWVIAFGVHLWRFSRGTLGTMGGARRDPTRSSARPGPNPYLPGAPLIPHQGVNILGPEPSRPVEEAQLHDEGVARQLAALPRH
jgi:hypothetical protein